MNYANNKCGILDLTFQIGETLLKNGAEISRVQETMERVAKALNAEKFDVYVLSNALFANGTENGIQRTTEIRHIPTSAIHFGRVSAVNQLSREIVEKKCSCDEAFKKLQEIKEIPHTSLPLLVLACAVGSAGFGYLMGGSFIDAGASFICGVVLEIYLHWAKKIKLSKFIVNLSASILVTLSAVLFFSLGLGNNLDKIIIGAIIRLVPGVALTTSIRDFFNGDYLSGTIRMIDALLVAGCIAIGVGVVLKLLSVFVGGVFI